MAMGLFILSNKLQVLNAISISLQLLKHVPCEKNIIHTSLSVTLMYSAICGQLQFKLHSFPPFLDIQ